MKRKCQWCKADFHPELHLCPDCQKRLAALIKAAIEEHKDLTQCQE